MLVLTNVALHRFKAAFEPPAVELQRFSLLIGRNGSGKSTVLEALQWIDTTLRRDAREASERYRGVLDLVNLRSQVKVPYFAVELTWCDESSPSAPSYHYYIRVEASPDNTPIIAEESLWTIAHETRQDFIVTDPDGRQLKEPGVTVTEVDRLALGVLASLRGRSGRLAAEIRDWWSRAVFLRLSPSQLAESALAQRRSFDPLLDEEGQTLPALLNELTSEQRQELVTAIQEVLPGMRDVHVSTEGSERSQRANYSLLERMPYRGRAGRYQFPIPAWMLSEGTRRLTAILGLLVHDPAPSLLCIEEVENGLDPWSVQSVLAHLREASDQNTQVVLTTHSPWLLDHIPLESVLLVRREEGNTEYRRFAALPEVEAFDPSLPAGTRYVNIEQ